jgi:hypothetical protein
MDSLTQRLLYLPPELHQIILDKYRQMYLFPEIKKKHNEILNLPSDKIEQNELLDIGDFQQFNYEIQKSSYGYKNSFAYNAKCITGVLEYYYSLNYFERNKLKAYMYENDNYDNYDNITCFLQNKNLADLLDPEDLHSGNSGMWVYRIVIKFMFASYEQKKELWFNLIKNHF